MTEELLIKNSYYRQILNQIDEVTKDLLELEYSYLLPQEKETLKALSFFPKITSEYLTRSQVINLLKRFTIGITLEARVYDLSLDKNEESDKVTTL